MESRPLRVAMVVPGSGPCGIRDYTLRLKEAYPGEMDLIRQPVFRAQGYDLLHAQFEPVLFRQGRNTLFPALMGRNRIPRVVTVHEVFEQNPYVAPRPAGRGPLGLIRRIRYDLQHALENREDRLARAHYLADAVVVHTRQSRTLLIQKGCPPERIELLPFPVYPHRPDPAVPTALASLPADRPVILLFGFFSPDVDFETVFRAYLPLRDRAALVLAGSARRREDKAVEDAVAGRIRDLGLAGDVVLTGFVEERDLDALFTRAQVFVHSVRQKTASASLAHALGAGLPIIAADLPHVREINAEVFCLKTYAAGAAGDLSARLLEFLDKETRSQWRGRVRAYAEAHSLRKFAEHHLLLYRRLLENSN